MSGIMQQNNMFLLFQRCPEGLDPQEYENILESYFAAQENASFIPEENHIVMQVAMLAKRGIYDDVRNEECYMEGDEDEKLSILQNQMEAYMEYLGSRGRNKIYKSFEYAGLCWLASAGDTDWTGRLCVDVINSPQLNVIEYHSFPGFDDPTFNTTEVLLSKSLSGDAHPEDWYLMDEIYDFVDMVRGEDN